MENLEQILTKLNNKEQKYILDLILIDPVSQSKNKKAFEMDIVEEIKKAEHIGYNLGLIMIDINNFKEYNDYYGHECGNNTIKNVAQSIIYHTKSYDTFYRYGGDEFIMLLPDTNERQLQKIQKRIKANVMGDHNISLSVGYAQYHNQTIEEFIHCADMKMYKDKRK